MAIMRNLKKQLFNMIESVKIYSIYYLLLLSLLYIGNKNHYFKYYETKSSTLLILLFGIIIMLSLTLPMQFQISGFRDAIHSSTTRKSFYMSTQIFKIVLSIFTLVLYLIFNFALTKLFNYNGFFKEAITSSLFIFSSVLFASTLAEFFGNIVNIVGKSLIFIILNVMASCTFILAMIFSFQDRKPIFFYNPYISFIILSISILISIVNWFLIKKCSLK